MKNEAKLGKTRAPRLALTVTLSEHGVTSPEEVKKLLVELIGKLPNSKLKSLRNGVITVIA